MTARSPGTNAPLLRRTAQALKRRELLIAQYIAEGMTEDEASERAQAEMRDNDKGDWRRG
jgi:hypothetical protein